MAARSRGLRSKSRNILTKKPRERGLPPVTHTLRDFPSGTKVAVKINASVHQGMPHIRFQGRTGTVLQRRGEAFVVEIRQGNKRKQVLARPEHLRAVH